MNSIFKITSKGKLVSNNIWNIQQAIRTLFNFNIRASTYYMNESDYNDIMKWQSGKE